MSHHRKSQVVVHEGDDPDLSLTTYERLRDNFVSSPRQIVAVKGLGEMPC